jgi:hypothetical protein
MLPHSNRMVAKAMLNVDEFEIRGILFMDRFANQHLLVVASADWV